MHNFNSGKLFKSWYMFCFSKHLYLKGPSHKKNKVQKASLRALGMGEMAQLSWRMPMFTVFTSRHAQLCTCFNIWYIFSLLSFDISFYCQSHQGTILQKEDLLKWVRDLVARNRFIFFLTWRKHMIPYFVNKQNKHSSHTLNI